MRVAIFGGAGFIGSHLCEVLARSGDDVLIFDNFTMGNNLEGSNWNVVQGNMLDGELIRNVLSDFKPNQVLHLAANSDIRASSEDPSIDFENTFQSTAALLLALDPSVTSTLVFASSSAIFGDLGRARISEGSRRKPESTYGWMKLSSELLIQQYTKMNPEFRALCLRFPNVTGARQTHGVVKDLVEKLAKDTSFLEVLGDGTQTKPYVHVSELVQAIVELIEMDWSGYEELNFAPKSTTSVREIVSTILEQSGLTPTVKYGSTRNGWPGDVPEYSFDSTKASVLLPRIKISSSHSAISRSVSEELRKWDLPSSVS